MGVATKNFRDGCFPCLLILNFLVTPLVLHQRPIVTHLSTMQVPENDENIYVVPGKNENTLYEQINSIMTEHIARDTVMYVTQNSYLVCVAAIAYVYVAV